MQYNCKALPEEYFKREKFAFRPYNSVAEVLDFIKISERVSNINTDPTLEPTIVCIQEIKFGPTYEYWWDGGVNDFNLVKKPFMNRIRFDYNTWINGGYKAVTRSGLSVDITGGSNAKNEVYGIVEGRSGTLTFDWKGKTKKTYHSEMSCEYDLFMIKKETDMNTVPFDYSLIEKGYTAQSKSGRIVADMHLFNFPNTDYSLHVQFADSNSVVFYAKNGMVNSSSWKDDRNDLVMVPPVYTKYIVVFPANSFIYDNFEIAKDAASHGFVCLLKVTYQGNEIIFKEILK